MITTYLFFIVIGFFSGSILYSYLIPKYGKHIDVTYYPEDHNPGASNAFRYAGVPIGLLSVACDVLKGLIPVQWAANTVSAQHPLFALVLCAPVYGHAFSPFKKGKGGKAIAVSFGVLLGLLPAYLHVFVLAAALIGFSLLIVIRPHRVRVIYSFLLLGLYTVFYTRSIGVLAGILFICAVVIWKHRPAGNETIQISLLWRSPFYTKIRQEDSWPVSVHTNQKDPR